jgi:hypothetical protein
MNETRTRGGPNLGLLLLIPAAVIIAKGVMRRRAMVEQGWGPTGGHRSGHYRFGGSDGEMGPRAFRLPPRIEAALDAWHSRAHEGSEPTKPDRSPDEA